MFNKLFFLREIKKRYQWICTIYLSMVKYYNFTTAKRIGKKKKKKKKKKMPFSDNSNTEGE